MFKEYDPNESKLIYCTSCGIIFDKETVKQYIRDSDDQKYAYLECPLCGCKEDVEYDDGDTGGALW